MDRHNLTKKDLVILRRACEEAMRRWEQSALNLSVVARSPEGCWPTSREEATRKLTSRQRSISELKAAMAKLGLVEGATF